jgi:hypothetical protein
LRFLTVILTGWTGVRVAMLWHSTGRLPELAPTLLPIVPHVTAPQPVPEPLRIAAPRAPTAMEPHRQSMMPRAVTRDRRDSDAAIALALTALLKLDLTKLAGPAKPAEPAARRHAAVLVSPANWVQSRQPAAAADPSRWSGDAWLLVRGGGTRGPGFGVGQLGGSQAGVRLAYLVDRRDRVALYGRVDTPLEGRGREIAAGVEWRPAASVPARLVAEERIPLDGGTAAPAVGAIAGLNPTPVAAGFGLEAYGQIGMIDRHGLAGFADGAARLVHHLARIGAARVDLGGGAWGGAQRGAARLDIGPSLGLAFRLGNLPARLTLDWRQRVAGTARPGSGLAVSLGTDF